MTQTNEALLRALCIMLQEQHDPEWAAWQSQAELKWARSIVRQVADQGVPFMRQETPK